jgi:hypothetical protein
LHLEAEQGILLRRPGCLGWMDGRGD